MAKFVKLFVALAALCILVLPAFSMPDYGMMGQAGQDGYQKVCGCEKPTMGFDGKSCDGMKSMMGNVWDKEKFKNAWDKTKKCGCHKNVKSMMGEHGKDGKFACHQKDIKSMMGEHGKDGKFACHKEIRSMMGGHGKGGFKAVLVSVRIIQ